jgi:hypothetical protein
MSYIILGGRCFQIIVLNVHTLNDDKIENVKESFYDELERSFDKFPKSKIKILLRDSNAISR